jgi:uncharacterized protein (TIGR00290 family)
MIYDKPSLGAKKTYFNWSGGKDSSLALYYLLQNPEFSIKALVTTVNEAHQRISMHGVRRELLHEQGKQIGIPVHEILLPDSPNMSDYETAMTLGLQPLLDQGIRDCAFGDIFLEDLRQYREDKLTEIGINAHFPLWKRDTRELIETFIDLGFKTVVVCTQADKLDASFVGRTIDRDFLADLPAGVDPCGENGEFHTFVYDGPVFKQPVAFELGEKVFRTYGTASEGEDDVCGDATGSIPGFHYIDLVPVS